MGKKQTYFLSLLFFLAFFLLNTSLIFAQTPQLSQRWVCLHVEWCLDQAAWNENPRRAIPNPLCAPGPNGQPVANGHRVRLTAKPEAKLLPSSDTYVVECLATTKGEVCTTGNPTTDNTVYSKDNVAALLASDNYQFQGIFQSDGKTAATNPVKSKANGEIDPVEWQSYSKGNSRKFFGLNFFDPNGGNQFSGTGAVQQGTFSFETQSNLKDCVSIAWDPYGRVFDSESLEPIPNASVALLKKRNNGTFSQLLAGEIIGGAIENPYTTKDNGYYSFVVPDGTYKLSVTQSNYVFPNDATKLNSGYTKAYSELYPQDTGLEILQKGGVQHRDIPLDPKTQGVSYPVKLIEYFYNLDKPTNKALLEGMVSHPLTNIKLYSIKPTGTALALVRYRLIKTVQADRYGKFKTDIDQSKFEPTEVFGDMELEKVDLTKTTAGKQPIFKKLLSFLFGAVQNVEAAQSSTSVIRFNPILNTLKGYAYDIRKNILPHANVGVYLSYSGKPYHQVKADENGYYEVPSERLPDSPYDIQYSTIIGGSQTATTSKFIAQNSSYLEKNNINLNVNKSSSKTPSSGKNSINNVAVNKSSSQSGTTRFPTKDEGTNFGSTQSPAKQPTLTKSASQNNSSLLFIVVILLFLIAGAGGLLAFYLIKKNKSQMNPY